MQVKYPVGDGLLPAPWFGKLLLVSLLVMLNLPVLFTGTTGMDQYGFYTLEPVSSQPWPLVLSIVVSSVAAGVGYIVYRFLRKKQTWYASNRYGAFHRNALLFGVSIGVAFAPLFFLTGYNDKPTALAVFGILATSLSITAALSDQGTRLDPVMARLWFIAGIAFILVFLILSVAAMLVMYLVEQSPSTGNFFWAWEFSWNDLGYPAEEFNQRHRNGLLAYTLAGSCYMAVAIGGSLLGAIMVWVRPIPKQGSSPGAAETIPRDQPGPVPGRSEDGQIPPQDLPEFMVALNGEETAISRTDYENMLAEKDHMLRNARLLVDKASGTAFAKTGGRWKKIPFRGRRKGPFLLLCVYARHPGRRFTASELEMLLKSDLPDRDAFNVSDFFAQLHKRNPLVPVQRDDHGTYIPETARVCFLDRWPAPEPEPEEKADDPMMQDSLTDHAA